MAKHFFSWRSAILDSNLPATTKYILLVLSTYMNDHGTGCYPTIATLARRSSLTDRSVKTHLGRAKRDGWLTKRKHGFRGQRWANNEYSIAFPTKTRGELASPSSNSAPEGSESYEPKVVNLVPEASESRDPNVVNQIHTNSSENSPENSPINITATASSSATKIHVDAWPHPDSIIRDLEYLSGVDQFFAELQVIEFRSWWRGKEKFTEGEWDSKFLQRCARAWALRNPS